MQSLFESDAAGDEEYTLLRSSSDGVVIEARRFVDRLWHTAAPYLDQDFPEQVRDSFAPRFWELYVAFALLTNGVALERRHLRPRGGPDFVLVEPDRRPTGRRTWVEAVSVSRGAGPDAVPLPRALAPNAGVEIEPWPDKEITLRLLGGLKAKTEVQQKYLRNGIVGPNDRYVVALGAGAIPLGGAELPVPRIVRAVFAIGAHQIRLDPNGFEIVGQAVAHRDQVIKVGGNPVSTDFFLSSESQGISAVLYAWASPYFHRSNLGSNFVTVRNPLAANTVDEGIFPFGSEWWLDGHTLCSKIHPGSAEMSLNDNHNG